MIAVIQFTNLEDLTLEKRAEINTLISLLHQEKHFFNPVKSSPQSWGGCMWAIGLQKAMVAYKLIEQ